MGWMQIFAAAAPVVASMLGNALAQGDDKRAEELRLQAAQEYNIDLPPVHEMRAQMVHAQGPSAVSKEASGSRLQALRQLQSMGNGYNDTDRAAINDALSDVNQRERGNRLAITQGMDPNSGAAIAAQLSNQQASAQRANQQGIQIAGQSRAQALRALMEQGNLAGDIQDDEFKQQQAGDAMAQFNARNAMGADQFNAGQYQDEFRNKFQLGNAKYNSSLGQSNFYGGRGDKTRGIANDVGGGVQKGLLGLSKHKRLTPAEQAMLDREQ